MDKIKITIDNEFISSFKRLSYKIWYALAEYVDNSTQSFENNKEILEESYASKGTRLTVKIDYYQGDSIEKDYFEISDNASGMNLEELKSALSIGTPKFNERSRYGLGMKTASFWLGDEWTITTKKINEKNELCACLNVEKISSGEMELEIKSNPVDEKEHYTIIKIYNLHRRFKGGSTIWKIKNELASTYRFDIATKKLDLYWKNDLLEYELYDQSSFLTNYNGERYYKEFNDIQIGDKVISGWGGILIKGGKSKGGFALIQHNRVIQSPPSGYKPDTLFGENDGTNNLTNQRLTGEIFLDGFEVSHTKDEIIWQKDEEDQLNEKLFELFADFKKTSNDYRKNSLQDNISTDLDFASALENILAELNTGELRDIVSNDTMLPETIIQASNETIKTVVIEKSIPQKIILDAIEVHLYVDDNMSINDPYVIHDVTSDPSKIIIIVNKNHPFWSELEGQKGIMNYLRQCIYDGVSEWKAFKKTGQIKPDTVKFIKDDLMRLPFELSQKF